MNGMVSPIMFQVKDMEYRSADDRRRFEPPLPAVGAGAPVSGEAEAEVEIDGFLFGRLLQVTLPVLHPHCVDYDSSAHARWCSGGPSWRLASASYRRRC